MIAAGLFSTLMLGRSEDHSVVKAQLARLRTNLPVWGETSSLDQSLVTWYYQNLVFFSMGGGDWARWNPGFRDLLVSMQRRDGCAKGSWDPEDLWSNQGGRVYSTAINVLNLEIYYKYSPSFLVPSESRWIETVPTPPGREPGAEEDISPREENKPSSESWEDRMKRLRELLRGK
jgi:hypothetical protein